MPVKQKSFFNMTLALKLDLANLKIITYIGISNWGFQKKYQIVTWTVTTSFTFFVIVDRTGSVSVTLDRSAFPKLLSYLSIKFQILQIRLD